MSVLWCCKLGSRKGIRPVKKLEWWGAGVVICLERDADLHMAQLMPLQLTVSCFSKIQIGFSFLVPAHPGSPGKRAVKRVCVCVCVTCQELQPVSFLLNKYVTLCYLFMVNTLLLNILHTLVNCDTLTSCVIPSVPLLNSQCNYYYYYAHLTASFPGQPG